LPDVDNPRLLRIDRHAERLQDLTRRRQRGARLRRGRTGYNPVVRVPRELKPLRRISRSKGVRRMLLSNGEATPPCGVPRSVGKSRPSVSAGAKIPH
jgi:hypothetical protein